MAVFNFTHIKILAASAPIDILTTAVPAGSTAIIKGLDFTCPVSEKATIWLVKDPSGLNKIVAAAQSDKYVGIPESGLTFEEGTDISIQLINTFNSNQALLGLSIYFELL